VAGFQKLPYSGELADNSGFQLIRWNLSLRNPVIVFQNPRTFGSIFGLPINSNARLRRISTNMRKNEIFKFRNQFKVFKKKKKKKKSIKNRKRKKRKRKKKKKKQLVCNHFHLLSLKT
jgi:hypothetical protein